MGNHVVTGGVKHEAPTLIRRAAAFNRRSLAYLAMLALLPFVAFWAETLALRVFYFHDLQYYFFPYHKVVADITASGNLPLWNPYAFSGIPLLGDGQTAMLYPPNWLFWLLPTQYALTIVVLLQFSIAGVGAFLYARSLQLSRLAAFVGALTFMFNGFLVVRIVHLSIMSGAALIPLVFWGMERLLQRGSIRRFVMAAVVVGVQALTGHPQIPIYTAVALGVYVLVVTVQRLNRTRGRQALLPLAQLAGVYVVGYALAAIQLAPWIEFASFSPRAAGATYEFVTYQSLARYDWWLFLFPYGYGGPRSTWMQTTPAWDLPVYLWERLGYVGLLPLALALVGLADLRRLRRVLRSKWSRNASRLALQRDRLVALAIVLIVLGLITAGASTPFGYVVYVLPVIGRLRAYSRAIALVCFVLAMLAAYGVERLRTWRVYESDRRDVAPLVAGALLLLAVSGALLLANGIGAKGLLRPNDEQMYGVMLDRSLQLGQANAYVPLLLALVSAAMLWWLRRGLTRLNVAATLTVIAFDLLSFALTFNPITDPAVFTREPPSVAFLRNSPGPFRTASFVTDDRLPPAMAQSQLAISWALPYGIQDINGFNSLQPRRYTDLLFGPDVEDVSYGFLRDPNLLSPDNRLLSMLNVKYAVVQPQSGIVPETPSPEQRRAGGRDPIKPWTEVYKDATVTIYQNPAPLERAYFAANVRIVPDPRSVLQIVKQPGFDPQQLALVEAGLSPIQANQLGRDPAARVRFEQVSPNELRLQTTTKADQFLVLSEMWFPGWRAEVDGRPLPIYRTNYVFRGLIVPAGTHTIRMYYRPTSALLGVGLTTLTIAGLASGWAIAAWRRKK